jgi:glycosyltransferase involved in cell wall biosynthesis/GT2 family glycosyltransferase
MTRVVTVAVPVLNGGALLDEVLAAVSRQRVDAEVELLIVDSGSTDGSVDVARRYGAIVHQITTQEFSHGGTRNRMIRLARGSHIAFITQDATPAHDGWLAALLEGFDAAPDVAAVFGPHLPRPDSSHMIARELEQHFATWGDGGREIDVQRLERTPRGLAEYRAAPGRLTFLSDVNCCLERSAVEAVPYRDVPYAEDQLLGRELIEAGYAKVFQPGAKVIHSHDYPSITSMRRYFDEYRGLREVLGHREPAGLRGTLRTVRGQSAADRAWLKQREVTGRALRRGYARSFRHYALRQTGAILGSRAGRLPAWARRVLSLEGRSTYDPIDVPRSPLLDPPTVRGRRVTIVEDWDWEFVRRSYPREPICLLPHRGRPVGPLTVAWVVPPWGIGSGGHTTIFRLVRELELRGSVCALFVFDPFRIEPRPAHELRAEIREHFVEIDAPVFRGLDDFRSADVAIATNWWTAYPVHELPDCLEKAYLVQDYEPEFHAASAQSLWAEETYGMGLRCLVFTPWLRDLLATRHGADTTFFPYGTDVDTYPFAGPEEREPGLVCVYARRETERRAVDLAIAALATLISRRPDVRVVLFGSNAPAVVPFPCENAGTLTPEELSGLYRKASVGVSLSLTNLSLVALEMLASGLPIVELSTENVTSVLGRPGELAMLAHPDPDAIATAIEQVLDHAAESTAMAARGRGFVEARTWSHAGAGLQRALSDLLAQPSDARRR